AFTRQGSQVRSLHRPPVQALIHKAISAKRPPLRGGLFRCTDGRTEKLTGFLLRPAAGQAHAVPNFGASISEWRRCGRAADRPPRNVPVAIEMPSARVDASAPRNPRQPGSLLT